MTKSNSIAELLEGYRAFSSPSELSAQQSRTDAPESTPFCGSAALSFLSTIVVSATINEGC